MLLWATFYFMCEWTRMIWGNNGQFTPQSYLGCSSGVRCFCRRLRRRKWKTLDTSSLSSCGASIEPPAILPDKPAGWAQPPPAMWTYRREERNRNRAPYSGSPPPEDAPSLSRGPMAGSPADGWSFPKQCAGCWCLCYSQHRCPKPLGQVRHVGCGFVCQVQLWRMIMHGGT